MDVPIDQYIRNFRIFYQQLLKGHKDQDALAIKFKALMEQETRKWRKIFTVTKNNQKSISEHSFLNKIKKTNQNKPKVKVESIYTSPSLQNVVVFAYFFVIFQTKNIQIFQHIQQNIKQPLTDKKVFTDQILRKISFIWSKFQQIVSGKRKVLRFQSQLQEYFKQFKQPFISLLYRVIIENKVLVTQNKSLYFQQLSKTLEVKIDYFQINASQIIKTVRYGQQYRSGIKMGLIVEDKMYVFTSKMPEKEEVQLNKQVTLDRFAQISDKLNQMYSANMKEYLNLNYLKNRGTAKNDKDLNTTSVDSVQKLNQSNLTSI